MQKTITDLANRTKTYSNIRISITIGSSKEENESKVVILGLEYDLVLS